MVLFLLVHVCHPHSLVRYLLVLDYIDNLMCSLFGETKQNLTHYVTGRCLYLPVMEIYTLLIL